MFQNFLVLFVIHEVCFKTILVLLDLENGRIPSEGQQIVNQLEEKLNSISKFATEAYNSIISNAQVIFKSYICAFFTLVFCFGSILSRFVVVVVVVMAFMCTS